MKNKATIGKLPTAAPKSKPRGTSGSSVPEKCQSNRRMTKNTMKARHG